MCRRSAGKPLSSALVSMLMLSGASMAADQSTMSKDGQATTDRSESESERFRLTGPQQMRLRNAISLRATRQKAPPGFNVAVGATVPSRVTLHPLPESAATEVPEAKPYHYAMVDNRILLVNPSDKRIVEVIRR
jgi:hypothetical protein